MPNTPNRPLLRSRLIHIAFAHALSQIRTDRVSSSGSRWRNRLGMTPGVVRAVCHRVCGRRVSLRAYVSRGTKMVGPNITISEAAYVGPMCYLEANHEGAIHIGRRVDIGPGCVLVTTTHDFGLPDRRADSFVSKDVVIGTGSWLGARVTVLPGCRLGPGCVVGANTLLDREYPPNAVIVGSPGRVIRTLEGSEG